MPEASEAKVKLATVNASPASARDLLRIVIVGHVDHGKSTLVGRMFHDTGSLPDGKYESIKAMCERRGVPFEWAFLMDALQAERDQGITIDTSQIWFKTDARDYTIIDAPGHKEFLKNMITGAAQSDAALLIIDAAEGVREQSRRHGYLLHLLGIRQVAVAVNKMDLIGYEKEQFDLIEQEYRDYLTSIGVTPTFVIPVSAREGDNIVKESTAMAWYKGPTVVKALDSFLPKATAVDRPLRFPVQDVYKFDQRRIIAGRIEEGSLAVGDELVFSPSNKTARVQSIEAWSTIPGKEQPTEAFAGESIGITLDEQIFVERGELASHVEHAPIETDVFRARIFWLGHEPMVKGKSYRIKLGTMEAPVTVQSIESIIDTSDLSNTSSHQVERNQVAEIVLRSRRMLALDEFEKAPKSGRFVLIDKYDIAGGGIISMEGYANQRDLITSRSTNITRVAHGVTTEARAFKNGHKGGVLWFTGLSGAGKSTVAVALEKKLFEKGYNVFVLDGDNVRHGLNANLSFSPEDRAENIRRVGEVAALFARAGMIAITSFISPYRSDRDRARQASDGGDFHEIFVKADVATCEARDPKGLYKKARSGEIKDFTGISAPYEEPDSAELTIDTSALSVDESVETLVNYVEMKFKV
ncbi:adenylyl-sulfate kinase [Parvibaculum sp.]|jgi:bifunctional enzyme CysN/CysC|uniref:adenylyl-sulfate kinase n=3 Tax=Parvibaculum sp. TaxID=2024848 RepID=UPI001B2746E1|nr:adenylyl-sulfate kinase [Parvibaculum sp.]MBO6679110.1 adenylyl-sulfate kinase [Parvibaculum sp.]MBO6683976.1 adenylyl-sulfate kinase [Parvibaculum sp.]MBO6905229.1 adenylyl-sulfate kinase [Parvibaculum sp.]